MHQKITFFLSVLIVFTFSFSASSQSIIELEDNQSMCITGKGIGQDGVLNPFNGNDSYAIIKNIGGSSFEARIQSKGKILKIVKVMRGKVVKLKLLRDHELYFDSNGKAKVSIMFEKIE